MKRLSDYSEILESEGDFVLRLLQEWKPEDFAQDEKKQEQRLYAFLKERIPEVPIKAQYGVAWGTADIVLQDEFVIELKLGFGAKKVGEFDRCLGQMFRYKEKWAESGEGKTVWLVTVGPSEAEFRLLLKKYLKILNDQFIVRSPFVWIEKTG